jgi:hypothetical protein
MVHPELCPLKRDNLVLPKDTYRLGDRHRTVAGNAANVLVSHSDSPRRVKNVERRPWGRKLKVIDPYSNRPRFRERI